MADLLEGQLEIDGYVFGAADDPVSLLQGGDVTTEVQVTDQDVQKPRGDGLLMGRDRLQAPSREFLLLVRAEDADAELARFRAAWRADAVRSTPQAVSVLRWCRHGHTYRAYGRGRGFEVLHKDPVRPDRRYASAVFQYREPMVFADAADSVTLGLIAGSLTAGTTLPRTLPWVLGAIGATRAGVVDIEGLADVPFVATITGPTVGSASGLKLSGPGWLLDFGALNLTSGQTITVDTAGVGSALRDGISVAGSLSRASTLTGRLRPGAAELTFSASDPSATTVATITWRPAALII